MILCDRSLLALLDRFIKDPDPKLVNPASIDIRIGPIVKVENGPDKWDEFDLRESPIYLDPGDFALCETLEHLMVPNGYSVELKLKSSIARRGWNHSLAFWFDPGWNGIGTMEIKNELKHSRLGLWYGMKFAQIIVHRNDGESINPYNGRYQNATGVESEKPEKI